MQEKSPVEKCCNLSTNIKTLIIGFPELIITKAKNFKSIFKIRNDIMEDDPRLEVVETLCVPLGPNVSIVLGNNLQG